MRMLARGRTTSKYFLRQRGAEWEEFLEWLVAREPAFRREYGMRSLTTRRAAAPGPEAE